MHIRAAHGWYVGVYYSVQSGPFACVRILVLNYFPYKYSFLYLSLVITLLWYSINSNNSETRYMLFNYANKQMTTFICVNI